MKKYPKIVLRKDDSPIDGRLPPTRPLPLSRIGKFSRTPAGAVILPAAILATLAGITFLFVAMIVALPAVGPLPVVRSSYPTEVKHALLGGHYIASLSCASEEGTYRARIRTGPAVSVEGAISRRWPTCRLIGWRSVEEGSFWSQTYEAEVECPKGWDKPRIQMSAMNIDAAVARSIDWRPDCEVRQIERDCSRTARLWPFCTRESMQLKPQRLP